MRPPRSPQFFKRLSQAAVVVAVVAVGKWAG
jgi:hypothetical protein